MSNIGKLTGYDKLDLSDAAGTAVRFMIENYYSIMNIASHLNNGDMGAAFRDIMDKGLMELGMICDMDDKMTKLSNQELKFIIQEHGTGQKKWEEQIRKWEEEKTCNQ